METEESCCFVLASAAEEDLAMSSATKEVATLRRGILKSLEMMLKMDMETPAEANSTVPSRPM